MNKKILWGLGTVAGLVFLVYLVNLFTLKMPVSNKLSEDYRNTDVELSIRYSYYIHPKRIAISLDECSNSAPVDILRTLLQTAEALDDRSFSKVELHKGYDHRFTIDGDYFKQLGEEYDFQNPVYTLRTFPEKISKPDGSQAYYNFKGGLAGLSEQMETFKEFTLDWCEE